MKVHSETAFESVIENHFLDHGDIAIAPDGFDCERAIFLAVVLDFSRSDNLQFVLEGIGSATCWPRPNMICCWPKDMSLVRRTSLRIEHQLLANTGVIRRAVAS